MRDKVIIVHLDFKIGGVESQLLNLLENYPSINDVILIVCSLSGELKGRFEAIKGLEIHTLDKYPRGRFDLQWFIKLFSFVNRMGVSVVYSAHPIFHWYVALLTSRKRKTFLSIPGFPHIGNLFLLHRFFYSISTSLVSVSSSITQYLIKQWKVKDVITISNCVVPIDIKKNTIKYNQSIKSIIIPCRIDSNKQVLKAIQALEICINEYNKDFELHIYGDGPELSKCKEYVVKMNLESNVFIHGAQNKECVHNAISASDLLILNSKSEGLPTVVIEAWAYHTLVLVNNYSGLSENFIKDCHTGFVNYDDTAKGLANKILSVSTQETQLLKQIVQNSFNQFETNYSLKNFISSHIKLFRE